MKVASAGPYWSGTRKKAFDRLHGLLIESNGVIFNGDFRTYELQTKGSSAVFRIPDGQRGNLYRFKGQLVLIICIDYAEKWPSWSGRKFAAVPVNASGEIITLTLDTRKDEAK